MNYLNSLKELRIADFEKKSNILDHIRGFIPPDDKVLLLGYQLTGAQLFIKNLFNPNTLHKRLLINWQTGVGKSIAAISIGNEFIKFFQDQYVINYRPQFVCILGFNTAETIKADLLKFPELGYVTEEEIKELNNLLLNNDPRYAQYSAMLQRRISDKSTGGYYKFFGYREFVNNLFIITNTGLKNEITIQDTLLLDKIEEHIANNYIKLNEELINSLKNSLIICDEIHNVYNSVEPNNYGLAIQYVLDILKENAPRAVFMSATPVTGNASEIIDLINLLNENIKLNRSDYFYKDTDGIYQLKDNALNQITKLTTGKVSFLIDKDTDLYPERIFEGDYTEVPHLRITLCELSKFHSNTVNQEENLTYAQQIKTIYDIVFPNPDSDTVGIYNTNDISKLQKSNEWSNKVGIETYTKDGVNIITGSFLHINNLRKYSIKYHTMLSDLIKIVKKPGKIMIFHYNVQMSGVILIQEILKMNGFIEYDSEPNNSTLCVVCNKTILDHTKNDHVFKPCTFIMAHSNINKATMKRNIAKFNDISNLYGSDIKIIIGSRIIQEGLNFKAIRYQFIMSLPINFPILIQVLGRVVRKNSHIDLPKEQRDVKIRIYAHTIEIPRYLHKSKEYLIIQEVEKAIRINAVDNFINFSPTETDTLESLRFTPNNIDKPEITSKYFDAYNYNEEEIILITKILHILFKARTVWTLPDIIKEIHNYNVNYNTNLIDDTNIELALSKLSNVINTGTYYIQTDKPDIECYFRNVTDRVVYNINLSHYYAKTSANKLFNTIMSNYNIYLNGQIELSLVNLPEDFHIELLKQIITGNITEPKIIDLYSRFKILIFDNNKPVGYLDKISINFYNKKEKDWYNKPFSDYNIGRRYDENNYIIGYVASENKEVKFKLRDPISDARYSDLRTVRKGLTCENTIREDLITIVAQLRKINDLNTYAYKYDQNQSKLSTIQLCNLIKLYMLSFEERSRNNMKNSIRWVYLFHDLLPNIMLK